MGNEKSLKDSSLYLLDCDGSLAVVRAVSEDNARELASEYDRKEHWNHNRSSFWLDKQITKCVILLTKAQSLGDLRVITMDNCGEEYPDSRPYCDY